MESDIHSELGRLIKENGDLVRENTALVKKLYRNSIIDFWIRIIWFALLIGLPFAVYFYVLEPYFEAFGGSYEQFRLGIGELPGFKAFDSMME
jgi:hypothetical protein